MRVMFMKTMVFALFYSVSGVFFPPDRWLQPSEITSKDGNATLDQTLVEGQTSNVSVLFTTVKINNDPTGYELVYQKYPGMFFVVTDGSIGLVYLNETSSLDRELDPNIVIEVAGGNPSGSGTATLIINVEDINDNAPVFQQAVYRTRVTSFDGITEGSHVATVEATDRDSGVNKELMYAITSGDSTLTTPQSRFSIDEMTGNVTTTGHAFERDIYALRITATDNGSVPLTGTTTLSVCINEIYCGGSVAIYTTECILMVFMINVFNMCCL